MMPLHCVTSQGVCVMVFDLERKRWVYIPEDKWYALSEEEKKRYSV